MTTREVVLDGGSPWGFRLHGGADVQQPLRISRVNPGSKAALRGIREGDFITSINSQSAKDLSNSEAHSLLKNSGDSLRLGLNEDCIGTSNGSPKRRLYKSVHQETHSETVKKSSVTSYTVTSSSSRIATEIESGKVNGDNGTNSKTAPVEVSQRSTLSSNSSTTEEGKSGKVAKSQDSVYDVKIMSDNGNSTTRSTRRRRARNQRNKKSKNSEPISVPTIEESPDSLELENPLIYRVESPKTVEEPNVPKTKKSSPVKSKSLDDDEMIKIQELSGTASESEDCNKAIVSEADSDWELAENFDEDSSKIQETALFNLSLPLECSTSQEISLISPEDELNLRNFLEGLNLVNCPEDAAKQVEKSTLESMKVRKAKKREALEQYFIPIIQNPRFLDVISEENSDLSDREQQSVTHHLKQGTPENDLPNPTSSSININSKPPRDLKKRDMKSSKVQKRMQTHFCAPISNPMILVGTKITEIPVVKHEICSTSVEKPTSFQAELVYLNDSSDSSSPDPKSDNEDQGKDLNDSSASSSAPDLLQDSNKSQELEITIETSQMGLRVSKNDVLVSETRKISDGESKCVNNKENGKHPESQVILSELTPPPTPDNISPNEEFEDDNNFVKTVISYLSDRNFDGIREVIKNPLYRHLPVDIRTKIEACLKSPSPKLTDTNNGEVEDLLVLPILGEMVMSSSPSPSLSLSSGSSSRATSLCTAIMYNPNSSIADIMSISKDEELLSLNKNSDYQPSSLRELCLKYLMSQPFGVDILQELAEVSSSIEAFTNNLPNKVPQAPISSKLPAFLMTSNNNNESKSSSTNETTFDVAVDDSKMIPSVGWVGLPTEDERRIVLALSPTQKEQLERGRKTPNEAGKLLDLHEKFINRIIGASSKFATSDVDDDVGNNRLLAIIRSEPNERPQVPPRASKSATLPPKSVAVKEDDPQEGARLKARDLSEWLQLARNKSTSESDLLSSETKFTTTNESNCKRPQTASDHAIMMQRRRTSLPQDFYANQMQFLLEKEREIQRELERLEDDKRKLAAEMAPSRQFHPEDYKISKRGDYAETKRPLSMPAVASTEVFRQQMYEEYMDQVAAREERKQLKVIKVTSSPGNNSHQENAPTTPPTTLKTAGIEDEFMDKVKEKQKMGKLLPKKDDGDDYEFSDAVNKEEDEPVLVMDGESLKGARELPKHLQEFVDLTKLASDENNIDGGPSSANCGRKCCKDARRINRVLSRNRHKDSNNLLQEIDSALVVAKGFLLCRGVWSPGQKRDLNNIHQEIRHNAPSISQHRINHQDDPISPIWTPKSATSSPTVERKEFRPVKFESPVLGRKSYSRSESAESSANNEPLWKAPETISSDTGISTSSTLPKRLPTSHSSPASGFGEFSTSRLPKVQNPTITLLQKAREGQLPKGASYIQNERPPLVNPGEILYQIKHEYTSESDSEKPRKMADLGPRKAAGIGPTTKDGMPLILRSEVKDANQSRWYKKMYDTIHKQRPHRDEYVTVRYKQKRGQYPYCSGYLSEPEPGAYDSDYADYKYATLDRRRLPPKEYDYTMSSTLPTSRPPTTVLQTKTIQGASLSEDSYRTPPGRIENYRPGHSSISDKEAKEWWDEVMDIFDGWLDDNSALPSYDYMFARALARSHLEQQKRVPPHPRSFINQALKESGYESDSTLIFRRRDDTAQQLNPIEQKEAYKVIQKGGDVPLHGLRKPAPERPKAETDEEFCYIKPQKEILCYPVTIHPHPSTVFASYKRTAPSQSSSIPKPPPMPPSPPRRRSSRNNSTLRLVSTMKVKTDKLPICKRHETCFTTNIRGADHNKVKYLRDKITCKLSSAPTMTKTKDGATAGKSTRLKVSKTISTSPEIKSRIVSTISRTSGHHQKCCSTSGKKCKRCATLTRQVAEESSKSKSQQAPRGTFGAEKRKVDLVIPKSDRNKLPLISSPDLLSPNEVKKAVPLLRAQLPSGTVYKKSTAFLSSKDAIIPIRVGITDKGKAILKSSIHKSAENSPKLPRSRTKSLSPLPVCGTTRKAISTVGRSTYSPLLSTNSLRVANKSTKTKLPITSTEVKKLKKSKKEQINGQIASKSKELVFEKNVKCAGRAAGTEIAKKLKEMEEFGSNSTLAEIQRQKDAIQSDFFFQHLFLRDLNPSSPTPSMQSRNSWIIERTSNFQQRRRSLSSEPTINAMKVYLQHTRPVSDSKFKSLDSACRSRSVSPKSVTWESDSSVGNAKRSSSLPPKLHFSQTTRPVSPKVERHFVETPPPSPKLARSPSSRKIMQLRNQVGDTIYRGTIKSPVNSRKELSLYSCPSSLSHSTSSIDSYYDRKEYQTYIRELLGSTRKSNRFKDLNDFYSSIEKYGQLEKTIDLKPRGRLEDEIIDYDRWKEVRTRERAERELKGIANQLKEDQKEKGFLFSPKQIGNYKWRRELDRGLRIKEKSVENIKEEFERIKREESDRENAKRREISALKDTYKPLWRGDSVLSLANKMVERRSHSEGRTVSSNKQKLIDSERMLTHGIGSRLWSSLSSEQVNILKNQLTEIYGQSFVGKSRHQEDYTIQVSADRNYKPTLSVRRNSDTYSEMCRDLSEDDKKLLSQSISREVLDRVNNRKKKSEIALPLVLAKETRGAIAAADANLSKSSLEDYDSEPQKALIKTDATNLSKLPSAYSETESGSTDESCKTVIYVGNTKDEIKKKVDYFESAADKDNLYTPTVHRPYDDVKDGNEDDEQTSCFKRTLSKSQSYQNLKEYFGERELEKFATIPLAATRPTQYISPQRPELLRLRTPSPPISETTTNDSFCRSRSLSPKLQKNPLVLIKMGEVRRLKREFEYKSGTYPPRSPFFLKPRRTKSDPSLGHNDKPAMSFGDVEFLRRKYEFPAYSGRGRSRVRRGVISPTFLKAEDRFMPHINIISKIANLYGQKSLEKCEKTQSMEELAKILGCPVGEVRRMREKFDSYDQNISLLGRMFTSSPNVHELRDIAPYLAASWIAHRFPKSEDNARSLSSPETHTIPSKSPAMTLRRHKSSSPVKKSSILKKHDPKMDPLYRYQPEPVRYKPWWPSTLLTRPSVSFQEPEPPAPPPKGQHGIRTHPELPESPRKYVENEVTIHYKTPVRQEIKEYLSEDELAHRQADVMRKIYQEDRRRKYLQELQDMNSRRHTDNFIPSQKSPISLNRYDDFDDLSPNMKPRPKSPERRLMARALYNFVGQTARELTFRKGDLIYVRRQVDKNWYEGELNAMVGLFPVNYVEIVTYDAARTVPRKAHEGQARAKFNFVAQTHLELSLAKGELVVITRRVDDNWFEGKIGGRKGIFPVSYVEVLIDPSDLPETPPIPSKPVAAPAAHSLLLNGSAGGKESMGSHSYTPNMPANQLTSSSSSYHHAKPVQIIAGSGTTTGNYGSLNNRSAGRNSVDQALHIETQSEPIPYRAMYKYLPQNDDELELLEGDTVYVLEKCDDGWYVGSSDRTGAFGTFPGNYVEKI